LPVMPATLRADVICALRAEGGLPPLGGRVVKMQQARNDVRAGEVDECEYQ